jgi:2-polyprenyl-3-methyl-5-hydroxy-6-metoxy-1,4-benzoquinol methylase
MACQFATGNLLDLPYSGESFDLVVSLRLLAHVRAWPRLVQELARAARHGVIVDFPTVRSVNVLTPALFGAKRQLEGNTRPYRLFREREVVQAFAREGFVLRERRPQFVWPMVLHRALGVPRLSAAFEAPCAALGLREAFGSPVIALFERTRMR